RPRRSVSDREGPSVPCGGVPVVGGGLGGGLGAGPRVELGVGPRPEPSAAIGSGRALAAPRAPTSRAPSSNAILVLPLRAPAGRGGAATPMISRIDKDHSRFREIVRGKIRQNLRKYISRGDLMSRKGKDTVSIPMPQVDIPRFTLGGGQKSGVGQGEGEPGDPIGGDPQDGESGQGEAGEGEGQKALEVEVTLDELAAILGEELGLPRIEPKGSEALDTKKDRYISLRSTGPESLRSFKATFKRALRRQVASGTYVPNRPIIVP